MKKTLVIIAVVLSIFLKGGFVYAQELEAPTDQPKESQKITYTLSYPGLLPDHPLYFIKAGREKIMAFFISHPLKKAEFNLLQADKRMQASYMVSQKGSKKIDLAQSTFSKGENYYEDAINYTKEAKRQGIDITEFSKKLVDANKKHQQVFSDMTKKLHKRDRKKFVNEAKRLKNFESVVESLAPNK